MADFPSLPLFTDAFTADTLHLNAEETGAYLMLLICAWRTPDCDLPDDDAKLARFARCTPQRWRVIRAQVMAFWHQTDRGTWAQKRLLREREHAIAYRDRQRARGQAGGRAKAAKSQQTPVANATAALQPKHSPSSGIRSSPGPSAALAPTPTPKNRDSSGGVGATAPAPTGQPLATPAATVPPPVKPPRPTGAGSAALAHDPMTQQAQAVTGKLREMAEARGFDPIGWHYGAVRQWLADGADPARHIIPTIDRILARGRRPDSLEYFNRAIADAMAKPPTRALAPVGQAEPDDGTVLTEEQILAQRIAKALQIGKWLRGWGDPPAQCAHLPVVGQPGPIGRLGVAP